MDLTEINRYISKLRTFNGLKIAEELRVDVPKPQITRKNQINKSEIVDVIKNVQRETIRITVNELNLLLDAAMRSTAWGEMGDIIDSGELMDSVQITIESDTISIGYDSPYANLVHYGGYIQPYGNSRAEKVYIPARPWVESVILGNGPVDSVDIEKNFRQAKS